MSFNALTAISLSHFYAYKKIAESYDSALIFEDDAILSDNFMVKLTKYINELPADFDILSIGNGCNLHIAKMKYNLINIFIKEKIIMKFL